MPSITISKSDLLAMLAHAKTRADREDAKAASRHQKDEQASLAKFREKVKGALKWDYARAKNAHYNELTIDPPSCPTRAAAHIERAIAQVKIDSRKAPYRFPPNHEWYRAATWLPESERVKESVCD